MKEDRIRKLISQLESETLEFKQNIPSSGVIARDLSAFANANGGSIVFGVDDKGQVVGVRNPNKLRAKVEEASTRISPKIPVTSQAVEIEGKNIYVVGIESGKDSPYISDGMIYTRTLDSIQPITSETILEGIHNRTERDDELLSEVRRLSIIIEELNSELIKSKSWKYKLPDMLIGGVIGVIISFIFTLIIGI